MSNSRIVKFYLDPISPYAYLAWHRLKQLRQSIDYRLVVTPILFAGLLEAHGQKGPAEISWIVLDQRNY
jgi:2-hydroxychromene-2-carboxylate isomerase